MKKSFAQTLLFSLLTTLLWGTACNRPIKNEVKEEKNHPKLIKTIGSPDYGNVQCILQDRAGNLWFGTTQNGLYKYDGQSFTRFLTADGLNSNNVYCLLEDKDGKIWIGTEAGLCIYDGKTFSEIRIPLPKNLPPNTNEMYRNKHWVFSMIQAKNGNIWLATIDGVYVYDGRYPPTEEAAFVPFTVNNGEGFLNSNSNMERMLEDKAGNIWFGGRTHEGVYRYDGKSVAHFKLEELFQDGPKPKPHNWAWPQVEDKNGHIWFGNWGGAYRFDGKSFTSYTKKDGLPGGVTRIMEDKQGDLWFGGDAAAGLSRFNGKTFNRFTTKDGLGNSSIWSILEDKTGKIWVGTRGTGLYLYDGKSFQTISQYQQ